MNVTYNWTGTKTTQLKKFKTVESSEKEFSFKINMSTMVRHTHSCISWHTLLRHLIREAGSVVGMHVGMCEKQRKNVCLFAIHQRERGRDGDATTEKSECDMKYLLGLLRRMSRNRSAQDGSLLLAHTHAPFTHMQTPNLPFCQVPTRSSPSKHTRVLKNWHSKNCNTF